MSIRVIITDVFTGECEMTGKPDGECFRVQLEEGVPEAVIGTAEFIRVLRFKRRQAEKLAKSNSAESQTKKGTTQ